MPSFIASAHTFVGRRRHNEDAYLMDPEVGIFAVADGMGGYAGGEVASRLAVEAIAEFFAYSVDPEVTWPHSFDPALSLAENRIDAAVRLANERVCEQREGPLADMGSTLALVALGPAGALVAHLGDSRVYRLTHGPDQTPELAQITRDHSLYEQLREAGAPLPPIGEFAYANVITRALGPRPGERPDLQRIALREGDRLLICTDGLSGALDPEQIAALLDAGPVDAACERLVHEAFLAGSRDNITAVVVEVRA